jgi:exopolyphosphatase/guanosine-5'-triphosphate,3'-diphosphate pyrophosphatase
MQRVAGFDIGTNSLRVLIADVDSLSRIVASLRLGFAVRLGEGLSETGRVSEAALERTSRVLGKSALLARRIGTSRMLAGATHALRVAANSAEVVNDLEEAAGLPINILTPEEEAYYVYTGALSDYFLTALPSASPNAPPGGIARVASSSAGAAVAEGAFEGGFVIDVGGGSTTLIKGHGTGSIFSCTLPLGCVTLTERFLRHDPPAPEELQALGDHIMTELSQGQSVPLSQARSLLLPEAQLPVTGVGGAVTSIAAVSLGLPFYESRRVEGYILTREEIERCAQQLSRLPVEEMEKIRALGRRRAEIAVAGAFILSLLTCHLNVKRLTVSTRGLRYGLALEAAAHPAG